MLPLRLTPFKISEVLPTKPDNSEKHEGEERTEALKRIAGLLVPMKCRMFFSNKKIYIFLEKYFNHI